MPAGRPRKEIEKTNFEKLCGLQCTLDEISGFFNCSPDTIERWCKREYRENFAEVFKKYSANGKISLRRNQFKLSEKSAAMAIWLGKQYLDQTDKIEENSSIDEATRNEVSDIVDKLKKRAADNAESGD